MPERSDIQRDLELLTGELHRLEVEYNLFFTGRLPRPPWETRRRVETIIKRWDRGHIETGVDRFRFSTLQARYATFADLWDREMRAREEGRAARSPGDLPRPPRPSHQSRQSELDPSGVASRSPIRWPRWTSWKACMRSIMDARRAAGSNTVPFHKFTNLVRGQVKKLRASGYASVTFQVTEEHGQVSLTARGSVKTAE